MRAGDAGTVLRAYGSRLGRNPWFGRLVAAVVMVGFVTAITLPRGAAAASATYAGRNVLSWSSDHYIVHDWDTSAYNVVTAEFTLGMQPGVDGYFRWECEGYSSIATRFQWSASETETYELVVNGTNVPAVRMLVAANCGTHTAFHVWTLAGATGQFRITNAQLIAEWTPGGPEPSSGLPTIAPSTPTPPADPDPYWTYCPAAVPSGFVGPPGPSLCAVEQPTASPVPEGTMQPDACASFDGSWTLVGHTYSYNGGGGGGTPSILSARLGTAFTLAVGDQFDIAGCYRFRGGTPSPDWGVTVKLGYGAASVLMSRTNIDGAVADSILNSWAGTCSGCASQPAAYTTTHTVDGTTVVTGSSAYAWLSFNQAAFPSSEQDVWFYARLTGGPSYAEPTASPAPTPTPTFPPAPTPTAPPPGGGGPNPPSGEPADLCALHPTVAACVEVSPEPSVPVPHHTFDPATDIPGNNPNPVGGTCESDPTIKPGYVAYMDVPEGKDPGQYFEEAGGVPIVSTIVAAATWVVDIIWSLPARAVNTATWVWNQFDNLIVPGECVGIMWDDLMAQWGDATPFRELGEIAAAAEGAFLEEGISGPAQPASIFMFGRTISLQTAMDEASDMVSPHRGLFAPIVQIMLAMRVAKLVAGSMGVRDGEA